MVSATVDLDEVVSYRGGIASLQQQVPCACAALSACFCHGSCLPHFLGSICHSGSHCLDDMQSDVVVDLSVLR